MINGKKCGRVYWLTENERSSGSRTCKLRKTIPIKSNSTITIMPQHPFVFGDVADHIHRAAALKSSLQVNFHSSLVERYIVLIVTLVVSTQRPTSPARP